MQTTSISRKYWAVGIIFLFIGACIIPSCAQLTEKSYQGSRKTIITVDDDGDGDYTSISDAVNHSHPGDIIEVYSGTYAEGQILIKTPNITLIGLSYEPDGGNHTGKPLIVTKGYNWLIKVQANNVTVSNFSIQANNSGGKPPFQGPFIDLYYVNGCRISNNTIQNGTSYNEGVRCCNTSYIQINDNIIKNVDLEGIQITDSNNDSVNGNVIIHSNNGIQIEFSEAINVTKNKVNGCGTGIDLSNSQNNALYLNNLENNSLGVHLEFSTKNIIKHNNFIKNSQKAEWEAYKFLIIQRWKSIFNSWIDNYWGHRWIVPKMIPGILYLILLTIYTPEFGPVPIAIPLPFFQFDRHPAQTPYTIP